MDGRLVRADTVSRRRLVANEWEPASLGDERLDGQQRHLVWRLRALGAAVAGGKKDEVGACLRILSLALAEHWRDEERWMAEAGYPGISEHARRHDALLALLAAAQGPQAMRDVARGAAELAEALEEHMRSEDLKLGRFVTARANFKAMAEAQPGKGPALTPLPGALTPIPGTQAPVGPKPGPSKK
jgi:hemerythrin-like metal-binding protein